MADAAEFTVRQGRAAGLSPATLRSTRFDSPFHGVRTVGVVDSAGARCRAYATKMRADVAFAGVTAARLWGLPLPMWLRSDAVDVVAPHGTARPGGRGVVASSYLPGRVTIVEHDGMRVLSPADTWLSLASVLDLADLVAVGDALVTPAFGSARPALTTVAELHAAAHRRSFRGVTLARRAAALIRVGSLSRPESLTRVLAVTGGVPEPECNLAISPLMTFDLAWPTWRFGVDYHGASHRSATQHAHDVRRSDLAARLGWTAMQIAAPDLFDTPFDLLGRIRSRLAELGAPLGPIDVRKVALARR
jgi:hypothetical protein